VGERSGWYKSGLDDELIENKNWNMAEMLSAIENPCVYVGFHDLQKHRISKRRFRDPKSTSHIAD
jgi:hypothetical protein